MLKKLKVILGISAVITLCAGLAACSKIGDVEKYQKEGYDISVTYNVSDGQFYKRDGVSVVCMYKSQDYMTDGVANIKLSDPSEINSELVPTKSNPLSFFAGWYTNREISKSEKGKPIDDEGRELKEVDGVYYVYGTENNKEDERIISTPKYTYSGYWDFEKDVFTVPEEAKAEDKSLTLYAGWVPYFSFDYYYQDNGTWVKYASTSFDYKAVTENENMSEQNTMVLPVWKDGKLSFTHIYSGGGSFTFPDINSASDKPESLNDKTVTFAAAYEDEARTKSINGTLAHTGTFDAKSFEVVDPVKKIYVDYDPYERYIIGSSKQLRTYANTSAHYEITKDLDFTNELWPSVFSSVEFTGSFESVGGTFKIINANATVNGSEYGGLFARVGSGAVIKNVTFENATVNLASSLRTEFSYALFSGEIDEKAEISGVTVGGTLMLGALTVPTKYNINLLATGNLNGLTNTGVSLQVYGIKLINTYEYSIDAEQVTVDETNGNVTIVAAAGPTQREKDKEFYDIISSWRQNND